MPAIIVGVIALRALACTTPVFRFALEQWEPDTYRVDIIHGGALSSDAAAALALLTGDDAADANVELRVVDLSASNAPVTYITPDDGCAIISVRYPVGFPERRPIHATDATRKEAAAVLSSPVREKISELILDGESGVWVLLESGNTELDDRAEKTLAAQFGFLETQLELPELPDIERQEVIDLTSRTGTPPLRLSFSIVRLKRNDPAEAFFVSSLLNSEPGLANIGGKPIAFLVYGRCRVLPSLVGDGIDARHIEAACRFVVDSCWCEVKDQNPGVDMLLSTDWDASLQGVLYTEVALPRLTRVLPADTTAAVAAATGDGVEAAPVPVAHEAPLPPSRFVASLVGCLLFIVIIVMLATIMLNRKGVTR